MISVLLILLKILGIILLSLIGIVIVIMLLVLFVPIRYRFKGYYKDEFVCHGKVTWLLHMISVSINYETELVTSIKIFGIPLSAFRRKKVTAEEETDINTAKDEGQSKKPKTSDSNIVHTTQETYDRDGTEEKVSLLEKIRHIIHNFIQKINETLNKIRDFIINIQEKKAALEYYLSILRREEVKQAFSLCKSRILKLVKHILPKKMKVSTRFGFDDPSTTGYILAIYGMLPASIGKKIKLYPDFDRSILECEFMLNGSVNAWGMLYQLLCVLIDENCKALYKIVKKEILNERK